MAPPAAGSIAGAGFDRDTQGEKTDLYYKKVETFQPAVIALKSAVAATESPHSGPQGKVTPLTIIDDPADWKAATWAGREKEYTYTFTPQDIAELTASVEALKARNVKTEEDVAALTKADYSLPTLGPKLVALYNEVNQGRGFQFFSGFPVEQYKNDRLGLILAYWALAVTIGKLQVSQTDFDSEGKLFGSLINHISSGRRAKAFKKVAPDDESVNSKRLVFHSDQAATDLISLFSIGHAPKGGHSRWASAVAIHNELIRRGRSDLVAALSDKAAWQIPTKVDQVSYKRNADGSFAGFEPQPPFNYHDGFLSAHFASQNYFEIQLTPLQEEAIWTFAAIAEDPEFHLEKKLQPGDIEWIHNPTILHSRTDVAEGESPEDHRHLLRQWVAGDSNSRPNSDTFAPRSNVYPHGGFIVPEGSRLRVPFFPYSWHDGQGISAANEQ